MKKKLSTLGALVLVLGMVGVALAADATPGTIDADVFVMGLQPSPDTTEVVAAYWPESGGASPDVELSRTITGYGGYEFEADASGLSSPWRGSMVVSSDKPIASVAELMFEGGSATDDMRVGYYNGFSEPAETLYLPYAVYARAGGTGDITQYSTFSVQNTSSSDTNIQITYIDRDGTSYGPYNDTIPGNGMNTYDMTDPTSPGVPDFTATAYWAANGNWTGGVIIQADNPVAAALLNTWTEYAASYSALTGGGEKIYLTNVERKLYEATDARHGKWEGLTSIIVQNFDLDNPVDITVTFYSKATGLTRSFNDTLCAGCAHGYNTRTGADTPGGAEFYQELEYWDDTSTPSNTSLGDWTDGYCIWVGSAVVEGEAGANIAAVVFNVKMRQATSAMYASVTDDDAATTLAIPTAWRRRNQPADNRWNLLRVMNVGTGTANDIDFYFYNWDGTLAMEYLDQSAVQYQIVDGMNLRTSTFGDVLGDDWKGTVVVTSDQPIVATSDLLWSADRYGAFNAEPLD
ncbi:MAG: hypothetical protein DRI79_00150 [Chloroflexi bacterium]|nr:MAG: hypothetical protein DRI52_00795 [Chloroflexota bacterium]RLC92564.1 MAG: hypothetical protein DRI79_00150 [Chloroflexota bacterium]